MNINKNVQGHLFALTANVMWGLMAPIGKFALQEFSALSVTTFRMVGAAAAFWILSMFCKQEHVNHKDMLKIFFASLFALVFNQGVFIFGLSLTSPIDASIVTTTLPIITMIVAAIYLKEPVTNKKVLGIFVGAMGALILILGSQTSGDANSSIWGDLLCLLAQLSFSIYLTVFKGLTQQYSAVTINKWMFIYASMCYIPFSYQDVAAIEWSTISVPAVWQVLYVVLGGKLHRLHLRNDSTEVTPSHSGKYVQLCTANHRVYRSSSHGYRYLWLAKGNRHRSGISGCIHRDTKQVEGGFGKGRRIIVIND